MPPETEYTGKHRASPGRHEKPDNRDTEYVYVQPKHASTKPVGAPSNVSVPENSIRARLQQIDSTRTISVQRELPRFLGQPKVFRNKRTIFYMWIIAMALISFDEWHNNHILPRPSRLWYATLFYGLLSLSAFVDVTVPIANALAIGYTIMLLWQYYNGGGQFSK